MMQKPMMILTQVYRSTKLSLLACFWTGSSFLLSVYACYINLANVYVAVFVCSVTLVWFGNALDHHKTNKALAAKNTRWQINSATTDENILNPPKTEIVASTTTGQAPDTNLYQDYPPKPSREILQTLPVGASVEVTLDQLLEVGLDYLLDDSPNLELLHGSSEIFQHGGLNLSSLEIRSTPLYRLRALDFMKSKKLRRALYPQLRLLDYEPCQLHQAILKQAPLSWPQYEAFKGALPTMKQLSSMNEFFVWFLNWEMPASLYNEFCDKAFQKAMAHTDPVRDFKGLKELLRRLDKEPFLYRNFNIFMNAFLTNGALSQLPDVRSLFATISSGKTYFEFFTILDQSFWDLCPPNVPGRPRRKPRINHHLRNGLRMATSLLLPPSLMNPLDENVSFTSRIYFRQQNSASTAYWNFGSTDSFISPTLANELGLDVVQTNESCNYLGAFDKLENVPKCVTTVAVRIPGLPSDITHTFVVLDPKLAPVVIGQNFWFQNGITFDSEYHLQQKGHFVRMLPEENDIAPVGAWVAY